MGGSFARDPEGLWEEGSGNGLCLQWGSGGQPGMGISTRDFEMWLKGSLWVGSLSLSVGAL